MELSRSLEVVNSVLDRTSHLLGVFDEAVERALQREHRLSGRLRYLNLLIFFLRSPHCLARSERSATINHDKMSLGMLSSC